MLFEEDLTDHSIVFVERGRTLKKNEFDIKFYLFRPHDSLTTRFEFLFQLPFMRGMTVRELKAELLKSLNEINPDGKLGNVFGIRHMRLREKVLNKKKVGRIYQDGLSLVRNIRGLCDGFEIAIQRIDEEETVTSQHRSVWLQRWNPDTLSTQKSEEVIIRANAKVADLKKQISLLSGIAVDDIGITKAFSGPVGLNSVEAGKQNFTHTKINDPNLLVKTMPLRIHDGDLVLYQDNTKMSDDMQKRLEAKRAAQASRLQKAKKKGSRGAGFDGAVKYKSRTRAPESSLRIGVGYQQQHAPDSADLDESDKKKEEGDTDQGEAQKGGDSASTPSSAHRKTLKGKKKRDPTVVMATPMERDYSSECAQIQSILPHLSTDEILQALEMFGGHVERTISALL